MSIFKVGLIGCGGMGTHLANQCHALDDAKITAVCDPVEEAAARLAEEFGAAKYPSYTDLLASGVDGVIVATPNDLHAPVTIEAARKGIHIFCEKPMALTVADCDAMISAAEKARVKLMVGQVLRLIGIFWKTHQIISAGELGNPFAIFVVRLGGPDSFTSGWRITRKEAGGILFEVHVHELDFMRHIMGEAKSVYASAGHFTHSKVEYEDTVFVQINYANGGMGVLHCGISSSIGKYDMMVQCEKGTLINGGFAGPITYSQFGQEAATVQASEIEKEDPYHEEVRSWVEAITQGTPMVFDARDGRNAIELTEAAYRSAATGQVVKLPL